MNEQTRAFLEEKLDGLRLARECEQAVVMHLEKYDRFLDRQFKNKQPIPPSLLRAVRQLVESRSQVREFTKEIKHIQAALNQSEVPEWVKGWRNADFVYPAPKGTTYELQPKIGVP